jgi:glucose-6-phosphate 1-dehydrogenase
MSHEDYIQRITQYIKVQDPEKLEEFKKMTSYVSGQYDEDASFQKLNEAIEASEKERKVEKKNRVYYMALPPSVFIPVAQGLKRNVYTTEGSNRLVVEKPFGMDSESSDHLGRELGALFTENEVN